MPDAERPETDMDVTPSPSDTDVTTAVPAKDIAAVVTEEDETGPSEPVEAADEPVPESSTPTIEASLPPAERLSARLPFWFLGGAWVLLVSAFGYLLWPGAPAGLLDQPLYPWFVIGGTALTAAGFFAATVVWLSVRSGVEASERPGIGRTVWRRALVWTAAGVALWWAVLIVLDLRRTGVLG